MLQSHAIQIAEEFLVAKGYNDVEFSLAVPLSYKDLSIDGRTGEIWSIKFEKYDPVPRAEREYANTGGGWFVIVDKATGTAVLLNDLERDEVTGHAWLDPLP